jgi:hypothetical protein
MCYNTGQIYLLTIEHAAQWAAVCYNKHLSQNNFSDFTSYKALCSWQYGVIPVAMEFIFFDPHSGEFLI